MYLRSLRIHGFKSFADKTTLDFPPGITGIVGPNGCGKSNVVDAIRWVLGETSAKALRGGEMADVIFAGSDKRKAVGLAEVTLTLADCEAALKVPFHEMAITRRVHRDGKGEYLLNQQACRLRDIQELLMDTGIGRAAYSVMEQGKIDMLLSSRPEDRRQVFEEAAGITKFKSQKREALRKLEITDANLLRVRDIITEVKRRRDSVQRQAQKARRWQALSQALATLDLHFSYHQYAAWTAETEQLEAEAARLKTQHAGQEAGMTEGEAAWQTARQALSEAEAQLAALRQQLAEQRGKVQSAAHRMALNRERLAEQDQQRERWQSERTDAEARLSNQETELESSSGELDHLRASIAAGQGRLAQHQAAHAAQAETRRAVEARLQTLRQNLNRLAAQKATAEAQLQNIARQTAAEAGRRDALASDLALLSEAAARQREEDETLADQIESCQGQLADDEAEQREIDARITALEKERRADEESLRQAQGHFTRAQSRLEVLRSAVESGEGMEEGVRNVLRGLGKPEVFTTGLRGLLSAKIEVTPAWLPAIEGILRERLQTVLVTHGELAEQILERLREQKMGRVALHALDRAAGVPPAAKQFQSFGGGQDARAPVVPVLSQITAPPALVPLLESWLGPTFLVPDLKTAHALKQEHPGSGFLAQTGEWLAPDGLWHGGAEKKGGASLLLREAEVRDLTRESARWEAEVERAESARQVLAAHLAQDRAALEEIRARAQEIRSTLKSLAARQATVQRELQKAATRLEGVAWEEAEMEKRLAAAETQRLAHQEAAVAAESAARALAGEEAALAREGNEVSDRERSAAESLQELKTSLAVEQRTLQAAEQQLGHVTNAMDDLRHLIARRQNDLDASHEKSARAARENEELARQLEWSQALIGTIDGQLGGLEQERAARAEETKTREAALAEGRRHLQQLADALGKAEVSLAKLALRLEHVQAHVRARYQQEIRDYRTAFSQLASIFAAQWKKRGQIVAEGEEDTEPNNDHDHEASPSPIDWPQVELLVTDLRQKLDHLGPVNLDSIPEFEELETRAGFLQEQHDDLVKAKEDLLKVLKEINDTSQTLFIETFASVRDNFRGVFAELFGEGAKADLMLMDETDPLECGIEIIAKPPGKKLQTITLLSGGERSMTAVALLFSIYMVKPSPFCVLDELDAPLDEANITRFLKMVDRFTDKSQFLIVTHNKRTMARADILYGVTMEERGVSKPVSLRLAKE